MDGRRYSDGELIALLPVRAPARLAAEVMDRCPEELGDHVTLFRRVSRREADRDRAFFGWPCADEEAERRERPGWAARCVCASCGEEWFAGWGKGGRLLVCAGEDGENYGIPSGAGGEWVQELAEGDGVVCPGCGEDSTLKPAADFRREKSFRLLAAAPLRLCPEGPEGPGLTGVIWYLVSRTLDSEGETGRKAAPVFAAVLDRAGELRMFRHLASAFAGRILPGEAWEAMRRPRDPGQYRYSSAECGSAPKTGERVLREADMPGETRPGDSGEKTGLLAYLKGEGEFPFLYLRLWRKQPRAEVLARAGAAALLDSCFRADTDLVLALGGHCEDSRKAEALGDWSKRRPHEILGVSRAGLTVCRRWDYEKLGLWRFFRDWGGMVPGEEERFDEMLRHWGKVSLDQLARGLGETGGKTDLKRLDRYLRKQNADVSTFLDYRRMLAEREGTPGPEELWPARLRDAHDRLAESQAAMRHVRGFAEILDRWGGIEYSDGELCALLPRNNGELVAEGRVLHHCVGSYGAKHVRGEIVVFIRHARRPERSWFTLNVDLTGDRPREIQLHGYRNEWIHGKRLRVPARVREFCDRWEKEVLEPAFREDRRRRTQAQNATTGEAEK